MTHRVMIAGMDSVTAFGENWQDVSARLLAYEDAVRKIPEWQVYDGLHTLLGAPVDDFTLSEHYIRRRIRAMGRVSQMSTRASELTLEQAGLIDGPILTSGETGVTYSSSTGGTGSVSELVTMLTEKHTNSITGTTYVQMVPYATVVNTGLFFGLRGRVIPTSDACTSDSQAIGYAWEAIRHGYQMVMIADGTGELCPSGAAVFDTLFATSQHNDVPRTIPSPLDENRDGLVIDEDAGTLILEELKHIRARGTAIYGEIVDFAANCDATHITQPQRETIQYHMEQSPKITGLSAQDIGYVSAHGATTNRDDIAESLATATIYGDNVLVSSLKSYSGHTLGTYGALEAWMSLQMMREDWSTPALNLNRPDPNCGVLDYIVHET